MSTPLVTLTELGCLVFQGLQSQGMGILSGTPEIPFVFQTELCLPPVWRSNSISLDNQNQLSQPVQISLFFADWSLVWRAQSIQWTVSTSSLTIWLNHCRLFWWKYSPLGNYLLDHQSPKFQGGETKIFPYLTLGGHSEKINFHSHSFIITAMNLVYSRNSTMCWLLIWSDP